MISVAAGAPKEKDKLSVLARVLVMATVLLSEKDLAG
jgi:hypothetical protein